MVYVIESDFNLQDNLNNISNYAHELINEFEYSVLQYKYDFLVENGYVLEEAGPQAKKNILTKFKALINKLVVAVANMRDNVIRKVRSIIEKAKNDESKAKEIAKARQAEAKAKKEYEDFKKRTDAIDMDDENDIIILGRRIKAIEVDFEEVKESMDNCAKDLSA